jgi:acylphosphatase
MRWWVRSRALELGLAGWAANRPDGRVEVVAEGTHRGLDQLLAVLREGEGPGRITAVVEQWSPARGVGPDFLER